MNPAVPAPVPAPEQEQGQGQEQEQEQSSSTPQDVLASADMGNDGEAIAEVEAKAEPEPEPEPEAEAGTKPVGVEVKAEIEDGPEIQAGGVVGSGSGAGDVGGGDAAAPTPTSEPSETEKETLSHEHEPESAPFARSQPLRRLQKRPRGYSSSSDSDSDDDEAEAQAQAQAPPPIPIPATTADAVTATVPGRAEAGEGDTDAESGADGAPGRGGGSGEVQIGAAEPSAASGGIPASGEESEVFGDKGDGSSTQAASTSAPAASAGVTAAASVHRSLEDRYGEIPLSDEDEDEAEIDEEAWILGDGETVEQARERVRRRRQKRRRVEATLAERGEDPAVAAAMKIFGVSDARMLEMMEDDTAVDSDGDEEDVAADTGDGAGDGDSIEVGEVEDGEDGQALDPNSARARVMRMQGRASGRGRGKGKKREPMSLEMFKKVYEPSELKEKYITEDDQLIVRLDAPERMLLDAIEIRMPEIIEEKPEEAEIREEAVWIYNNEFATEDRATIPNLGDLEDRSRLRIESLQQIINCFRVELCEPPFVAQYHSEYVTGIFEFPQLWTIQDWDIKWRQYYRRRGKLISILQEVKEDDEYEWDNVGKCEHDDTLDDLYAHAVHRYRHLAIMESMALPGADRMTANVKDTVDLVAAYGITGQQIGENVEAHAMIHIPEDPDDEMMSPEEIASRIENPRFHSEESALAAAREVMAMNIATDPLVRAAVRDSAMEYGVLNVAPVPGCERDIDAFHPYAPFKYIKNKPVMEMGGTQFVEMMRGEDQKMLTIQVAVPAEARRHVLDSMSEYVHSDGTSPNANLWNEERTIVLEIALEKHLFPMFEKEMRRNLQRDAEENVIAECVARLKDIVFAGPAASPHRQFHRATVMAVTWPDSNREAAFAIMIDRHGNPVAHIKLQHIAVGGGPLLNRIEDFPVPGRQQTTSKSRRDADVDTLYKFIRRYRPEYIITGANTLQSRRLHECIRDLVVERNFAPEGDADGDGDLGMGLAPDAVYGGAQGPYEPVVTLFSEELARVYEHCPQAGEEFPDYPLELRRTVGLARHVQEPIYLAAAVCKEGASELASVLDLHNYQSMCNQDKLAHGLTTAMVDCVNSIGVDLGRCAASAPVSYLRGIVQFLCGLGPRKAKKLLRVLGRRGGLASREVIRKLVGPVVFRNMAGFVRIPGPNEEDAPYVNPDERNLCDSTRVHPEDYNLALKIAIDALEAPTEDAIEYCIEKVLEDPSVLDDIDVRAFATVLEAQGKGNKYPTLMTIVDELKSPYFERRPPFAEPNAATLFTLLTGLTDDTIQWGQIALVKITRIAPPSRVFCKLEECGLQGYIQIGNFSSNQMFEGMEEIMSFPKDHDPVLWTVDDVLAELQSMNIPESQRAVFATCMIDGRHFLSLTANELVAKFGFDPNAGACVHAYTGTLTQCSALDTAARIADLKRNQLIYNSVGSVQLCRVVKVDKEKALVELSSRSVDLNAKDDAERLAVERRDKYYDTDVVEDERFQELQRARHKAMLRRAAAQRVIPHPQYRSMNGEQAEAFLEDKPVGDAVIRPSQTAVDHLVVSWKFHDHPNVVVHLDVAELDKAPNVSIGKRLQLTHNDEIFEDLDEILARFVEPTAMYAQEMAEHPKFRTGTQQEIENALIELKVKNPKGIPYLVGIPMKDQHRGQFMLSYLPGANSNVRHELVAVEPSGYSLRRQTFATPNRLINWFKAHWKEDIPVATPRRRTPGTPGLTLRTPMAARSGIFPQPSAEYPQAGSLPAPVMPMAMAAGAGMGMGLGLGVPPPPLPSVVRGQGQGPSLASAQIPAPARPRGMDAGAGAGAGSGAGMYIPGIGGGAGAGDGGMGMGMGMGWGSGAWSQPPPPMPPQGQAPSASMGMGMGVGMGAPSVPMPMPQMPMGGYNMSMRMPMPVPPEHAAEPEETSEWD